MFDTANGFPFVASGATNSPIPAAGATFSLKALDIPVAVVRILHQTYQLNIRVLDAKTGKSLGFTETGYQTETDRNTNDEANQYWSFTWKGGVVQAGDLQTAKPVPDGVYKLRVEALKMTGNPKNINDYYTWTSAPITIKRA
ncbi:hypothetical protein GQ42DRAFT_159244 [Ramicandelaber brevisporus]|nr:hypothetical protein GQ42DRAFT_159482 [Ramicandelaber brevisporus]KAI8865860.1 hypothetical protein GQ42DRAFT_159244 [Ramicandelaber brevisporus]